MLLHHVDALEHALADGDARHDDDEFPEAVRLVQLQAALLKAGADIAREAVRVVGFLSPPLKIAESQGGGAFARLLSAWMADLEELKAKFSNLDGITGLKDRLTESWLGMPKGFAKGLAGLIAQVEAKPDQTATLDAQTFLSTAQLRLGDYREAMRKNKIAEIANHTAKAAYDAYCRVMEDELNCCMMTYRRISARSIDPSMKMTRLGSQLNLRQVKAVWTST